MEFFFSFVEKMSGAPCARVELRTAWNTRCRVNDLGTSVDLALKSLVSSGVLSWSGRHGFAHYRVSVIRVWFRDGESGVESETRKNWVSTWFPRRRS